MFKSDFSLLMENKELREYLGEQTIEMNLSDVISNMFASRDDQDRSNLPLEDESKSRIEISIEI